MTDDKVKSALNTESVQNKATKPNSVAAREGEREIGGMIWKEQSTYNYSEIKTLDIPKELLNNELIYRYVNEDKVAQREMKGYQVVSEGHFKNASVKTRVRTGKGADGKDTYSILMAIPKDVYDKRKKAEDDLRNQRKIMDIKAGAELGEGYVKQFTVKQS